MPEAGNDARWLMPDGRVIEFWDGGDPQGRAVVMQPGTPASRVLGRWGHDAAVAAGVRLVSVSRPGYGGSTPTRAPSLMATGRDVAGLAASLGLHEYAVLGISGGAPVAVATAIADPQAVRALAIVGGVGPWPLLDEPTEADTEERAYLAMFDAGDAAGAWEGLARLAEQEMGGWRALDDEARVDAVLGEPQSPLARDNAYRALWASNMRVVLNCLDGYVTDGLAQGGTWDVDPADVRAPTVLWDADGIGARHVAWYADRMAGSELVIFSGEGHLDVCDLHWPEVLAGLLRVWA